jgi:hypothetical protein
MQGPAGEASERCDGFKGSRLYHEPHSATLCANPTRRDAVKE